MNKAFKHWTLLALLMTTATGAWAADPDQTDYVAACAAIQDGGDYTILTKVNNVTYYVTTAGLLTSVKSEAGCFNITKTSVGSMDEALFAEAFRIYGGTEFFTNPPLSGDVANLNPGSFVRGTQDRYDWERQVLYLNEDGKYAIRSCNTAYGESGWNDAGRTFWTYSTADDVTPCYTYEPAYVWEFEVYEAPPTYTVSMKDGVQDADKWTAKEGDATEAKALPLKELNEGTQVTVKYNGSLKVKDVKATVK